MKKIIYIFLIVHCTLKIDNCLCQVVQQEWVARYPEIRGDYGGPFLALDRFGNSYVAGAKVDSGMIKILVVKYNSSGVQQWATQYKYPPGGCHGTSGLALDSSGNPCVTGMFWVPDCLGQANIITVKFNTANGSVIWERPYFNAEARDIKIDGLNNIYAVGIQDSGLVCIKYNTNGDSVWVRRYHAPGALDVPYASAIDDSLNILITGYRFRSPPVDSLLTVKYSTDGIFRWAGTYHYGCAYCVNIGTKITADQYGSAYIGGVTIVSGFGVYLTLKYDRNGVQQWAKIYDAPGNGDDLLKNIAMDRRNNFLFVTGNAYVNGVALAATIKYNASNGDSVWVRTGVGLPGSSGSWDIKVDTSGNAYITGGVPGASSSSDVLTLKYFPQGNQGWLATYNGPYNGSDGGRAIELDNLNNVYVCGTSQSAFQVSDYIVIKYSQLVGIQPISNEIPGEFKLHQNYPNPFNPNTTINYELPIKNYVKLVVYDVLGREAATLVNEKQHAGSYNVRFDGTNYSSGVYFYKLIADGNVIDTKKLVILK